MWQAALVAAALSASLGGAAPESAASAVPEWLDSTFCTIPRIDGLSLSDFNAHFRGRSPVIFSRPFEAAARTRELLGRDALLGEFGHLHVRPGRRIERPEPSLQHVPLSRYVTELMAQPQGPDTPDSDAWNNFGPVEESAEWAPLLQDYPPPLPDPGVFSHLWWGVAPAHSGLRFHGHGAAFSETLLGRKRWYVAAPQQRPAFSISESQLQWVIRRGPPQPPSPGTAPNATAPVLECTVGPGEVVYVPPHWWHGTVNLEPWTASVSSFTTEVGESHHGRAPQQRNEHPEVVPALSPTTAAEAEAEGGGEDPAAARGGEL